MSVIIDEVEYEEVESEGCRGCAFLQNFSPRCVRPDRADDSTELECDGDGREDGNDVIFVRKETK